MKTKQQITTELEFDKIMYFDQIESCHEAMEEYANQYKEENQRLREALEKIADYDGRNPGAFHSNDLIKIAKSCITKIEY